MDEEESEPPEFDLRTGRLISHSRPMRMVTGCRAPDPLENVSSEASHTLVPVVSPGAEFLRSHRTWQGLGSDFDTTQTSAAMEEGRRGRSVQFGSSEKERSV
jgi:diphthamide biosynthesis protein 2